jgi:hypothetical protein
MKRIMVEIKGQQFIPNIELIERLLVENPDWGRYRLSIKLCKLWDWYNAKGQLKDMACRTLLLRLEKAGQIVLPARQRKSTNGYRNRKPLDISHQTVPIETDLKYLRPLKISCIATASEEDKLFRCLLDRYHYLGYRNTVGENLKYLLYSCDGQPLACLLFGSAALACAPRDTWFGWSSEIKRKNLCYLTNNTRFLILPWIKVPNLASHVLSQITHRIGADWQCKYAHPLYYLETFVDQSRYRGTCYRSANWTLIGQTKGRGRNGQNIEKEVPVKDLYLYPLIRHARDRLCDDT